MSRRQVATAVTGLLCLVGLVGCATGRQAQTYKSHSYDYLNVDQGAVAIRNLAVDGPPGGAGAIPAGGTARATGSLVDQSDAGDVLTAASSSDADRVALEQGGRPATSIAVPQLGRAGDWAVVLTGTHTALRGGSYVSLTLTFARAGRTTLRVPVRSTGYVSSAPAQPAAPASSAPTTKPSVKPSAKPVKPSTKPSATPAARAASPRPTAS